eukprot:1180172-Prorocentrum_minimum.AAC.6
MTAHATRRQVWVTEVAYESGRGAASKGFMERATRQYDSKVESCEGGPGTSRFTGGGVGHSEGRVGNRGRFCLAKGVVSSDGAGCSALGEGRATADRVR